MLLQPAGIYLFTYLNVIVMYIFRKKADFSFSISDGVDKALRFTLCFVLVFVLGVGLSASNSLEVVPSKKSVAPAPYLATNDVLISIVIDVLSIDTTNPSNTITKIKIFDASMMQVFGQDGCNVNHCTVNVKHLTA
ncbi:MAG: hypothetical protein ACPGXL_08315, partial [Chitinophagales bacterium]